MSPHARDSVLGLPLDRLFAIYMLAALPPLAFANRPASWPVLLALHAVIVLLAWPLPAVQRALATSPSRVQRMVRGTLDWAPLLLVPLLYTELAPLNAAVHGGAYFDELVIAWEQAIFAGQPSRDWAAAVPLLWLSEPLHAAYLSYYLIIFVPPLVLFLRRRTNDFRAAVFALMLAFFMHYLFFIYFPVQGPRYLFPPPGGVLADGFFYQVTHRVLEAGSSQGAAFPSSHVGVSVAQTLIVARYLPRLTPVIALLTVGLAFGAIYGGFHYATDAVAGLILGVAAFAFAPRLARMLAPRNSGTSDETDAAAA
ncbi:MAG: phosphatase PAP2 family protein [Gemmatimonadetes bacterium]|nr:phosphatase PAP2 family protein [Gemmatimonadota bacterium]